MRDRIVLYGSYVYVQGQRYNTFLKQDFTKSVFRFTYSVFLKLALSFWPLAVGSWLVLLHPVGTLGNVESEGRTPPPTSSCWDTRSVRSSPSSPHRPVFVPVIPHTSSCFRPRHPHIVLFSSPSSPRPRRPAFVPVIPTSSCRDARECLAGGRPFPSSSRRPVGTHDLCVRCVKSYSIVI